MACFIFGGSNSILRGGWSTAFAQRLGQPVQNRSVRATTTLTGLFRFLATEGDSTPSAGDCVIWEYALNEVNHLRLGYQHAMLLKNIEHLIILCRQRGCTFLPLVFTSRHQEQALQRDPYYLMLANLFAAYGIAGFDVSAAWRQQTGATQVPDALYDDNAHYAQRPEITDFIASGVAELAPRARIPADSPPLYTGGTELGLAPLPSHGLHRNSLLQIPTVRLPQRVALNRHGRIAAICTLCQSEIECGIRLQLFKENEDTRQMRFSVVNAAENRIIVKAVSLENALGPRWATEWRFRPGDSLRLSASLKPGDYYAENAVRRNL